MDSVCFKYYIDETRQRNTRPQDMQKKTL